MEGIEAIKKSTKKIMLTSKKARSFQKFQYFGQRDIDLDKVEKIKGVILTNTFPGAPYIAIVTCDGRKFLADGNHTTQAMAELQTTTTIPAMLDIWKCRNQIELAQLYTCFNTQKTEKTATQLSRPFLKIMSNVSDNENFSTLERIMKPALSGLSYIDSLNKVDRANAIPEHYDDLLFSAKLCATDPLLKKGSVSGAMQLLLRHGESKEMVKKFFNSVKKPGAHGDPAGACKLLLTSVNGRLGGSKERKDLISQVMICFDYWKTGKKLTTEKSISKAIKKTATNSSKAV